MTSRSISSRNSSKKSLTTQILDIRSRSHHRSQKKIDSNTLLSSASGNFYVAHIGDTPTKITLKRRHESSAKDLPQSHNSSSKSDMTQQVANVQPAASSLNASTKVSGLKSQQVKSVPLAKKHIKNGSNVPLVAANDKKGATDSDKKCTAKASLADLVTPVATPTAPTVLSTAKITQTTPASTLSSLPSSRKGYLASTIISFSWKSANALYQMQTHNLKFKQQVVSLPVPSFTPSIVTAIPPMPPNWIDNYEDTNISLLTFKKYTIDPSTAEYKTIDDMLQPIQPIRIEKIVNPDLWKRLVNTRKGMLRSKTDDLNLLSELGLDERDVMRCTHLVMNQGKKRLLTPYSDNMALLFHCTKTESNLNSILSQGLDERLSNVFGGRLGKGIYFADNPEKALQYDGTGRILIFAVLLGDCISVDHFPFKNALVREPEKHSNEMRNLKDSFFDSIVGRPAGYNEYVIYNRHQCCPLYEIVFKRSTSETKPVNASGYEVKTLPSFAWLPDDPNYAVKDLCLDWPFHAADIFKKMGSVPIQDVEYVYSQEAPLTETNTEQMSNDRKLATLLTFGFCDADRNKEILTKFNNDLYLTLNYLLDDDFTSNNTTHRLNTQSSSPLSPSTLDGSAISNSSTTSVVTTAAHQQLPEVVSNFLLEFDTSNSKPESISEMEECTICCNEYKSFDTSPAMWKQLKCKHKLCVECHAHMLTSRTTMSVVTQTFVKCPYCHDITGIQIGTCPNIKMIIRIIPDASCEGYETSNTISINYVADADGYQLNRTAYLPNNDEGNEVLKLLKVACDRRLCFSIGESVTTGKTNVLVWGIHHKTSMRGGVLSYGYPDPGYMHRVKLELKSFGIQ